jgi:DNA-binding transcriptional LysR family regulator
VPRGGGLRFWCRGQMETGTEPRRQRVGQPPPRSLPWTPFALYRFLKKKLVSSLNQAEDVSQGHVAVGMDPHTADGPRLEERTRHIYPLLIKETACACVQSWPMAGAPGRTSTLPNQRPCLPSTEWRLLTVSSRRAYVADWCDVVK